MEREILFFRKVCATRHSRDIVRSFLSSEDSFKLLRLFNYADLTFYARKRSHDDVCSLQTRITQFLHKEKETRCNAIPLYHLEVLEKSLEALKEALKTFVGDVVQTARIPKGKMAHGITLLFPEHGPLEGLETWIHSEWIRRPANHHYPFPISLRPSTYKNSYETWISM